MTSSARSRSVLVVAYHFAPDNASGTHRALHFARSLVDAGHRVSVLTIPTESLPSIDPTLCDVFPYDDRILRVPHAPILGDHYLRLKDRLLRGGRTPSGARETARDHAGGSDTHDVSGTAGSGILRRLRRELAAWDVFPDEHRGWYPNAVTAGLALHRQEPFDAVFVSAPPWTALRVGHAIARRTRRPLIADFRDPWTERSGRLTPFGSRALHARARRIERRIVQDAALVLFNSPAVQEVTKASYARTSTDRPAYRTILNGSEAPRRTEARPFPSTGPLALRHFGSLYRGRSMGPVIQALLSLADHGRIDPGDVVVELVGARAGRDAMSLPDGCGPENLPFGVQEIPSLPFQEAVARMMDPAVLVVVQPPVFDRQIPTKLYDYLCTGNPVLVLAGERSATWMVAQGYERCRRADPGDREAIAAAIDGILERRRSGELQQVRTDHDTAPLAKDALGKEFVGMVEEVLQIPGHMPGSGARKVHAGAGPRSGRPL